MPQNNEKSSYNCTIIIHQQIIRKQQKINHEETDRRRMIRTCIDDVTMNNETAHANAHNNNGNDVEEYVRIPADFERINRQYNGDFFLIDNPAIWERFWRQYNDEDENEVNNPAFCLTIVRSYIRDIPDFAVQYCNAVTDVRVLQGGRRRIILRTIGEGAFCGCKRLRRINQFLKQGGVIRLEKQAFLCCKRIEGELIIPNSVLSMGEYCFGWCKSITSVVFEPSTTGTIVELQSYAFLHCTKLSSATIPPNLERIPQSCFDSCTALTTVTIRTASSVLQFGNNIFRGCTSLSNIRMYPWHWGKLLSSMKNDATFLNKFFNGTLTPLHRIQLTSWYGARILDAVNDQPSLLYRVLRQFQHQRFVTTTDRVDHHQELVRTTTTMAKHPGKRKRMEE